MARAQPPAPHVMTTPAADARYEILQSSLSDRWTFRLDRYCGRISRLVETPEKNHTWEEMDVKALPNCNISPRPHFQIFLSSLAARFTFLIDTESGETWKLLTSTDEAGEEVLSWELLE